MEISSGSSKSEKLKYIRIGAKVIYKSNVALKQFHYLISNTVQNVLLEQVCYFYLGAIIFILYPLNNFKFYSLF